MAFTVRDYQDLTHLLAVHPEWQAELRRLILSEDFLALPAIVRELAEAQKRTEARVDALAARVDALAEEVRALTAQVSKLAEGQQRLTEGQQRLVDKVGRIDGRLLELTYREKAGAYFGRWLRGLRVVPIRSVENALEASLSPVEFDDVLLLDLLLSGRPRRIPDAPEVWLAVEVSAVIDRGDVERAQRRAALLRKAGYPLSPADGGLSTHHAPSAVTCDACTPWHCAGAQRQRKCAAHRRCGAGDPPVAARARPPGRAA